MQATRRRDTPAEVAIRSRLFAEGLRYRVQYKCADLGARRSIDIAFPGVRVAVFVDGCFWHSCPVHATRPRANGDWWRDKLRQNVLRDADTVARLEGAGWTVLRVWEHEDPMDVAGRVARLVRGHYRSSGG
jgi:DNA mismatch endonuclease (patch repair protein)